MKKVIYNVGFIALMSAGVLVNAQTKEKGAVGINTQEPQATLDVRTFDVNGTTNEGIIAPKLSKERVANIATPVEGTLVYVTKTNYSGTNTAVAKIDDKGYYYFDGTEWVKAKGGAAAQAVGVTNGLSKNGENIILGGTLTKATNINQAGNNLTTTGDGNVGIGTDTPTAKLEVDGSTYVKGLLYGGFGAHQTGGSLTNQTENDWNNVINARSGNGYALLNNSAANGPLPGDKSDEFTHFYPFSFEYARKDGKGNMTQFAIPYRLDNNKWSGNIFIRSRYSNDWSSWIKVLSEDKDGKVAINGFGAEATLDVNGNARIRTIADGNPDTDYVVLADTEGNIKKADVSNFKGPKGDTGAAGAQGPAGAVGPKGDKGEQGDSGVAKGVNGITYNEKDKSVALGGELTEATTINQNNHNLTFTTGATGQFKIDGTSNITGAQYVNIRTVTEANFTLKANDYMISYKGGGGSVTLPEASDATGRVVCFFNYGIGEAAALATRADGRAGNIQPSYGGCIVSDGTKWITKNAY